MNNLKMSGQHECCKEKVQAGQIADLHRILALKGILYRRCMEQRYTGRMADGNPDSGKQGIIF